MQDPLLREGKLRSVQRRSWDEVLGETTHDILGRLPDLVAEATVCVHYLDVEVKVTAACDVGKQCETEGISTALRNATRERGLLILGSLRDLIFFKIADQELVVEGLKLDTVDDIQRVNDIS